MQIGLMLEAHYGLTWERWRHIVRLADRLGFASLFRSDHFFGLQPPQVSLDAPLSMAIAATESSRIRFGTLVTPVTFWEPVHLGRMAAQIDRLSGGRFVLGLGIGWNEAEHRAFGLPFPPLRERFDRLEDAIALMRALWAEGAATYHGAFYRLDGADCRPKPAPGRPPVLIGGMGERRTLRAVARFADEWNGVNLSPNAYASKRAVLERHCEAADRDPTEIRHSMMTFGLVGPTPAHIDAAAVHQAYAIARGESLSPSALQERARAMGVIVGGAEEVVDQLGRLADLGMHEVLFRHLHWDSDEIPQYLAHEIAPKMAGL